MTRTYLVECFWPGITEAACAQATARAAATARRLRASGRHVRFLDTLLVPQDEVVFFRFAATSSGDIALASALAELPYERITRYVETPTPTGDGTGDGPDET